MSPTRTQTEVSLEFGHNAFPRLDASALAGRDVGPYLSPVPAPYQRGLGSPT